MFNSNLKQDEPQHRSVLFIRIILKNFCLSFMKNSYDTFFRNLKVIFFLNGKIKAKYQIYLLMNFSY